jgi:predicted GNAT family N-acyltransferase
MDIKFLADRPDAVPTLARWYYNEWGHKEPGNSFEATCERLNGKLNRDIIPIPIIACESDGTVIGAAQLKFREMDIFPEREVWLGGVYVAKGARGRGVGAALVSKVADLAKALKVPEVWLQTEALNGGLYARIGWVLVEKLQYKGENIAVMVRRLGVQRTDRAENKPLE